MAGAAGTGQGCSWRLVAACASAAWAAAVESDAVAPLDGSGESAVALGCSQAVNERVASECSADSVPARCAVVLPPAWRVRVPGPAFVAEAVAAGGCACI